MRVRSTLFGSVRAAIFRELTTVARFRPSGGYFVAGSTPSVLHVLARGALSDYRLVSSHPSRQSRLPHAPARCKSQGGEGRSNALHCVCKSSRSPIASIWDSGNVPKPCENPIDVSTPQIPPPISASCCIAWSVHAARNTTSVRRRQTQGTGDELAPRNSHVRGSVRPHRLPCARAASDLIRKSAVAALIRIFSAQ